MLEKIIPCSDRWVEKLVEGEWVDVEASELKRGDIFRMYEDEQKTVEVKTIDGLQSVFKATRNPKLNEELVWEITIQISKPRTTPL